MAERVYKKDVTYITKNRINWTQKLFLNVFSGILPTLLMNS